MSFRKPYRVETWFERDRSSIVVYDAADREIAEWWDDDVQEMFESGYFTPGRGERALADSVLGYVKEMGLDMPAGLDRAAKMRRAAAKRQGKNSPEHPIHLSGSPHWAYTAHEKAAMIQHLKSLQLRFTPEDIFAATGISPLLQGTILRHGTLFQGYPEKLSKMYHDMVPQNNPGDVHLDIDIGSHNAAKGGRTSVNPDEGFKMTGGDIIKILNIQELPKTGMVTGTRVHYHLLKPAKNAKQIEQIILNRFPYGMKVVSHYSLRPEAYPGVKHAYGILLKNKAGKNPPLPASALMDISTAKTVVREVDSGARPPRPALSQADDLLDRGLQKLRGSHLGHVDWSNPPATEVYKNIVEIKAVKPNGKRYVHKFGPGSHILGLPNGDLLVQSRKGKRLWKNFETGE